MAVALVTGASSGIGLATAITLARGGHAVIATMRNLDGAGDVRKIVSEEKLPVEVAALNVDDDASVRDAIGKALAERGHIDVLVNNAGISGGGRWKRSQWISSAKWWKRISSARYAA
jgi:NAD(P)-dependent dehydrogenase (short-subunit alcohol dehydrogenase family)